MARPFHGPTIPETTAQVIGAVKHCPLTCGLPTRMSRRSFDEACAAERRKQQQRGEEWGAYGHKSKARLKIRCEECRGKVPPAEITIISMEEIMGGQSRLKKGKCALCSESGTVKSNHGLMVCTSCAAVQANINVRPQAVMRAMAIMRPELLDGVGQAVAIQVENRAMERLADLVGYNGQDGDDLLDRVELVVDQLAEAAQCSPGRAENCAAIAVAVSQYQERLAEAEARLAACQPPEINPADVAHLSHALDRYKERCEELAAALVMSRATAAELADQVNALDDQVTDLTGQVAIANGKLATALPDRSYLAGYLDDIRNVLELEEDFPADKLAYSVAMLKDGLAVSSALAHQAAGSVLDAHLLDLCLDAMRGHITGLDPDRIAAIRGAA